MNLVTYPDGEGPVMSYVPIRRPALLWRARQVRPGTVGVPAWVPGPTPTRRASGPVPAPVLPGRVSWWRRHGKAVAAWVLMVGVTGWLAANALLVGTFYIPSGSMEPTFEPGDRAVVVHAWPRGVSRGDVVVFKDPGGWLPQPVPAETGEDPARSVLAAVSGGAEPVADQYLLKRVIGVGGDRVVCCDQSGRVVVNGVAVDEPYVQPGDAPSEVAFDVTVPDGHLWLLGDHRSTSADSRYVPDGVPGVVPVEQVVGRVVGVIHGDGGGFGTVGGPGRASFAVLADRD